MFTLICQYCREEFEGYKDQKYCSCQCQWKSMERKKIELICKYCGKEFEVHPSKKNQKYCSHRCYWKSKKGKPSGTEGYKFPKDRYPNFGNRGRGLNTYQNRDWVLQKLVDEGKTTTGVAKEAGCSSETIIRWAREFGIPIKKYKPTEETKRKIGGGLKRANERDPTLRERTGGASKGNTYPKELYPNYGFRGKPTWNTGLSADPSKENYDERIAKTVKGMIKVTKKMWADLNSVFNSGEYKEKIKVANKKNWANPEYQKMMAKSLDKKPNKPEIIFDELTPECVMYVGDGQFFVITNEQVHNPDFKIRGQSKIIELFGDYWHKGENLEELIKEYGEIGWECIIFWEHEIYKEPEKVLEKTLKFIK